MAKLIPFSKYEAALLLDAYLEFIYSDIPRLKIIKRLSNDLRVMAVNNGQIIDKAYRSVSGISFQMSSMESAYLGRNKNMPATKLFKKIVMLYSEENDKYQELLEEAKLMVIGKKTGAEKYTEWLAGRVSAAKLSEIYICYSDIDEFFLQLGILHKPLIETTDLAIIKKVRKSVTENNAFCRKYKKRLGVMFYAVQYYYAFIKEKQENNLTIENSDDKKGLGNNGGQVENNVTEREADLERNNEDRALHIKYPLLFKKIYEAIKKSNNPVKAKSLHSALGMRFREEDIYLILNQASWAEEVSDEKFVYSADSVKHIKKEIETKHPIIPQLGVDVVDFSSIEALNFTKPVRVSCFGETLGAVSSWSNVYVNIVTALYKKYSAVIPVGVSFNGTRRLDFGDYKDAQKMTRPVPILGNMFLEVNLSTTDIVYKIKALLDICKVSYADIVIEYLNKKTLRKPIAPNENVIIVIKKHYQYGFRIDSIREIMRFRQYAEAMEISIPEDDNQLKETIYVSGMIIGDKVYPINETFLCKLKKTVSDAFFSGAKAIFYESLFAQNAEIMELNFIISVDMLKKYLQKSVPECTFSKNFMVKGEQWTEKEAVAAEIKRVWSEQQTETLSCLSERLPFIPYERIRHALSSNETFVIVSAGRYLYTERFSVSKEKAEAVRDFVEKACEKNGFSSLSDIPLEDVEEDNYDLPQMTVWNAVYKKVLADKFILNGKILTKDDPYLDTVALLKQYIKGKDECTFEEIAEKVEELTGSANRVYAFQALYDEMVRVDKNRFVSAPNVRFEIDEVDSILSQFIPDRFQSIRNVTTFAMFPVCGQSWNHYLLESYCYKFSNKFSLHVIRFNNKNAGIIAEKDYDKSYSEMLATVLVRMNVSLNVDEAGKRLFDWGYLAKSKYSKLNEIIKMAEKMRKER